MTTLAGIYLLTGATLGMWAKTWGKSDWLDVFLITLFWPVPVGAAVYLAMRVK